MSTYILIAILFATFSLAIYLANLARIYFRGQTLDDHPLCKNCHYDLLGSPKPFKQCPECGHDISNPKHILHGNRKRDPSRAIITFLFAILFASPTFITLYNINYNPYKPFKLLVFEMNHPSLSLDSESATSELYHRLETRTATQSQSDSLTQNLINQLQPTQRTLLKQEAALPRYPCIHHPSVSTSIFS